MTEREIVKTKDPEVRPDVHYYDDIYNLWASRRNRNNTGRVVIKGTEQPWEQSRQAKLKHFLHPVITDTVGVGWFVFIQDIKSHSGRHVHQGGLSLYVLEGKGWTVVDKVRHDWEEGDLILLPVKPHGCAHQHFNAEPGKPCKWLAIIYDPFIDVLGNELTQKEESPDWAHA